MNAASAPAVVLAALRRRPTKTSRLCRMIGGDRDDVSRAVAHLVAAGHVVRCGRPTDRFGRRPDGEYRLLYDRENPAPRYCIFMECGVRLARLNPGYTAGGHGPYCFGHRDAVEDWELDFDRELHLAETAYDDETLRDYEQLMMEA